MKGVPEKQSHEAIRPGVCSKQVKNPQFWATEPDSGEQVKLEVCFAVQRALDVVLQHDLGQLEELASLEPGVSEECEKVVCDPVSIRCSVVDVPERPAEQSLLLRLVDWQSCPPLIVVADLLLDKILRKDDSFQLRNSAIGGTYQVGEYDRNIEIGRGREWPPRLNPGRRENQLAHLGTQHHPQHRLLDEGAGAANVWTSRDYHFFVSWIPIIVSLFWDVDVAVLDAGELFAEDEPDHLLPQHGAGDPRQLPVDVLLQQLQHSPGHALHQAGLALGEGDVGGHLILEVLEVSHHAGVLEGLWTKNRFPLLLLKITTRLAAMVKEWIRLR